MIDWHSCLRYVRMNTHTHAYKQFVHAHLTPIDMSFKFRSQYCFLLSPLQTSCLPNHLFLIPHTQTNILTHTQTHTLTYIHIYTYTNTNAYIQSALRPFDISVHPRPLLSLLLNLDTLLAWYSAVLHQEMKACVDSVVHVRSYTRTPVPTPIHAVHMTLLSNDSTIC